MMDKFECRNGLSKYVLEELNKVTTDLDFNKNSLDIFSYLLTIPDHDSIDYMITEGDLAPIQQNLLTDGNFELEKKPIKGKVLF